MSSSKALRDVTLLHGCSYSSAMVGEVNVVEEMKRTGAVIGGEGNGGVIYPALHYGRDALAGIGLFLTHLAKSKLTCSQMRQKYPDYFMAKKKLEISRPVDLILLAARLKEVFPEAATDTRDGIKIDLPTGWIQIRKSNTEPIIRVYSEERSMELADNLAEKAIGIVKNL
jgi:phosphomannomutase